VARRPLPYVLGAQDKGKTVIFADWSVGSEAKTFRTLKKESTRSARDEVFATNTSSTGD
jgi:hypothetical protein